MYIYNQGSSYCKNQKRFLDEIEKNIEEIKEIIEKRTKKAKRLETEGKWENRLNIYYSCFTAALAVLSVSPGSSFLTLPGAVFTVLLAILVIYASAQRSVERAHDLRANCRDIQRKLLEIEYTMNCYDRERKEELNKESGDVNQNELLEKLVYEILDALDLQKDSEYPSEEDCKEYNLSRPKTVLVVVLFFIPILFIVVYSGNFFELFASPK